MKRNNYIVFTRTPWNEPPRARHQVAHALSKENKTVFIESNTFGFPKVEVVKKSENLLLVKSQWFYNYKIRYRIPGLNECFQLWLIMVLKWKGISNKDSILFNFDHTAHLIQYFIGSKQVYFCNDDHQRKRGNPLFKAYFHFTENKVIRNADLNVGTSKWLVEKLKMRNRQTVFLPLGAPTPIISPVFSKKGKYIKVLIIGFISEKRTPIEALLRILKVKCYQLTIIGRVDKVMSEKLKKYDNYTEKDTLIGVELERNINDSNVCLAIYNKKDVNKGGSPNKLWQYLAYGKPVIVSDLPSVLEMNFPKGVIHLLKNDKNICELIQEAYENDSKEWFNKRLLIAYNNSWNKNINKVIKHFNQ